ncbi:MAG: septum formation inhibitor Maf [Xanthomonadales bacterium]|nr:septum formation inhibitor Maf [Xanthomonadales bacterium]
MLYLASQSPRRRQLLEQLGYRFRVLDVEVPECPGDDEAAAAYVERVARDKAAAGWTQVGAEVEACVLAADTEVVIDGQVLGKPADAEAARSMLRRLRGRDHEVLSAVCCMRDGVQRVLSKRSIVRFAALGDADIDTYVASGEPFGKAGSYAIQGRAAAFISHLEGSYSAVMGLPLFETASLLRGTGLREGA